jgi:hypothetical protein
MVRRLAAVRPFRRAGNRDQDLQAVLRRRADELVDVCELVGRIVAVERVRRLVLRDLRPVGEHVDDRGVRSLSGPQIRRPFSRPAEARIVEETDRHPRRRLDGGRGNGHEHDDDEQGKAKRAQHGH